MPRVEDMTGFIDGPCKHPVLFFSSGGFYVICSNCSQMWESKNPMGAVDRTPDPGGKRVDPDFQGDAILGDDL